MTVALYRGKSITSRIIKWFTWGPYSHASWILRDGSVIEAWHVGGVRHTSHWCIDHTENTQVDFFDVQITPDQRDLIEAFLRKQVGKKYYFFGIMRFFSRRSPRSRHEDKTTRWFCSELVFRACQKAGVDLLSRIDAQQVSPALLGYSPMLKFRETLHSWRMADNEE